eukprot:SAG11_NODE_27_length_23309_cov_10.579362_6_plen_62_part_00
MLCCELSEPPRRGRGGYPVKFTAVGELCSSKRRGTFDVIYRRPSRLEYRTVNVGIRGLPAH